MCKLEEKKPTLPGKPMQSLCFPFNSASKQSVDTNCMGDRGPCWNLRRGCMKSFHQKSFNYKLACQYSYCFHDRQWEDRERERKQCLACGGNCPPKKPALLMLNSIHLTNATVTHTGGAWLHTGNLVLENPRKAKRRRKRQRWT